MHVKVFLATVLALGALTVTGVATWLFPLVNHIHEQMGGQPLQDPRGSLREQANQWLNILPADNVERAQIVCFMIASYLVFSSLVTVIAVHVKQSRANKVKVGIARDRTMFVLNSRPIATKWTPIEFSNEYTRDPPDLEAPEAARGASGAVRAFR